ncbi:hypothetical protein B0J17DRAFT_352248 [Rhizoctonia solani]|nr:hypothetical protein B0J17DRAFT_352248 [Rhizoctonia solani]
MVPLPVNLPSPLSTSSILRILQIILAYLTCCWSPTIYYRKRRNRKLCYIPRRSSLLAKMRQNLSLNVFSPRPYVFNFTTHSNAHEIIFSEHLEQYHERVAWSDPSGGDNLIPGYKTKAISFETDALIRILYGVYDNMFANEKITSMMSSLSIKRNGMRAVGTAHFQPATGNKSQILSSICANWTRTESLNPIVTKIYASNSTSMVSSPWIHSSQTGQKTWSSR